MISHILEKLPWLAKVHPDLAVSFADHFQALKKAGKNFWDAFEKEKPKTDV